jgi:hypothetical protein
MSTELVLSGGTPGSTVIAVIRNDDTEEAWNGVDFEVYSDASFTAGDYDVALTEQDTSGYFVGDFPDIIPAGTYNISYYTVETSRVFEGSETITWDGEAEFDGWITVSRYKTHFRITDDSQDVMLSQLIPMVSFALDTYMDRHIKQSTFTRVYRGNGLAILPLREFPVIDLDSVTIDFMDSVTTTIDGSEFYVGPTGTMYWRPSSSKIQAFGSPFISVSMTAGYDPVPADLQLACLLVCNILVSRSDPDYLVKGKTVKDVSIKYADILIALEQDPAFVFAKSILDSNKAIPVI